MTVASSWSAATWTTQFSYQEKFWGYRYIYKSFQDQYRFGNSADLGISLSYRLARWIEADAIITNGEGFKQLQVNDGLLYGIGTTITPLKGVSMRLYKDNKAALLSYHSCVHWNSIFIPFKSPAFAFTALLTVRCRRPSSLTGFQCAVIPKLNHF